MSFAEAFVGYFVVSVLLRVNASRYFVDRPDIRPTERFFGRESNYYSEGAGQRAFQISEGFARVGGAVLLIWFLLGML